MTLRSALARAWPTVRIVLSVLLLWKAIEHIDWHTLSGEGLDIAPRFFIYALLAQLGSNVLAGLRWAWLMRQAGYQGSFKEYVGLYFAGGLINQGLPTVIGGDSYRAIAAGRPAASDANATAPGLRAGFFMVALDRTLGLVGNNLLGAIGLIFGGAVIAVWAVQLGYVVLAAMLGGALLLGLLLALRAPSSLLDRLLGKVGMAGMLLPIRRAWGLPYSLGQLVLALVIHLLAILAMGFCLRAYGAAPPVEALLVGMPALGLLMMLPISISGWGLRENTLSAMLALWGTVPALTVLGSLSYGAVALIALLPGIYQLLLRKRKQ